MMIKGTSNTRIIVCASARLLPDVDARRVDDDYPSGNRFWRDGP